MFDKLALVTVLVVVHVQYAYVLTHLAEEGARQKGPGIRGMVSAFGASSFPPSPCPR
jgi:hypothetical protein